MPGSIHVSVTDFNELPSSSILVKASIGKSDYQTWGKADFSLPLKTLRDNVRITLLDADGNELAQEGFRIISIVEKGSLDESLSIEGGGTVHFKLRFVLNEEERNKIQRVRESAIKRKRDELLTSDPRYSKISASLVPNEGLSIGEPAIEAKEGNEAWVKADESDISKGMLVLKNEEQNRCDENMETREEILSKSVDIYEKKIDQDDASSRLTIRDYSLDENIGASREINRGSFENKVKEIPKIDAKIATVLKDAPLSSKADTVTPLNESRDNSSLLSISKGLHEGDKNLKKLNEKIKSSEKIQNKSEETNVIKLDRINFRKRPIKLDEASSNLEKEVAVLEAKKPLQKTSSNVRKMISAFESNLYKEMRPVIKPPPIVAPKSQASEPLAEEKPKTKPIETDGLKIEDSIDLDSYRDYRHGEDKSKLQNQVEETKAITKEEPNLLVPKEDICDRRDDRIGNVLENEKKMDLFVRKYSSDETSSAWIFPDEGIHDCAMTEIKQQVKDLSGNYRIEERSSQRFSVSENMEKDSKKSGIYTDVIKIGNIESSDESLPGGEPSSGPFGQAIKVAIMVAFGALILFTRR